MSTSKFVGFAVLSGGNIQKLILARVFESQPKLILALGKDISGNAVFSNLENMPHLLIAGTTGSGKSVGINVMITSILYKHSPDDCKFILIDPKMLELSVYEGVPHLITPVVTDPKKAITALKWVVREMESRYKKMSLLGVRNIENYNIKKGYIHANTKKKLKGAKISFPTATVTGTENIMMAAVLASGKTYIKNAAKEPEIIDICKCLKSMGCNIDGDGEHTIIIEGVNSLGETIHNVVMDRIELGTYMIAGAISDGDIKLTGGNVALLANFIEKLCEIFPCAFKLRGYFKFSLLTVYNLKKISFFT